MLRTQLTITTAEGTPLPRAEVVMIAPNGTFISARSDEGGVAVLDLPDNRVGTLFVAHPEHHALLVPDFLPEREHEFRLARKEGWGSVIFKTSEGDVPGLEGRLNPIQDSVSRTYIYGDNVSFNDQPHQPYPFQKNVPFIAEDAHRHRFRLTVLEIIGRTSLIEFERQ